MKTFQGLPERFVTDPEVWENRRHLLKLMGTGVLIGQVPSALAVEKSASANPREADTRARLSVTPEFAITQYNNYYEFSFEKSEPRELAPA